MLFILNLIKRKQKNNIQESSSRQSKITNENQIKRVINSRRGGGGYDRSPVTVLKMSAFFSIDVIAANYYITFCHYIDFSVYLSYIGAIATQVEPNCFS